MLGPLERYMTPILDAALLSSSRAGADLGGTSDISISEQLMHHTSMGFDPPFAKAFFQLNVN